MEEYLITLLLMIGVGILGAATRIGVQRYSNKTWPHEKLTGFLVALGLGSVGGYLAWELKNDRLVGFTFGYFLPDIIENFLEGFKPTN